MKKLTCLLLTILSLLVTIELSAQVPYDLLIKNVNIVDVKNGKIISEQNIYINADRITKITSALIAEKPNMASIDGTGKYLIPGLWDMHTHNWWNIHFSNYYIANGVLGVRNMYTPMSMIQPIKDSIDKNLLLGPKYFAAGRIVEGTDPEFPDWLVVDSVYKIKAALDTLQMEGSDFVKIYNKVPREVYFNLLKEAHKRNMEVEGHLPMSVSALEASQAGQKSFEHLLGLPDLCTKDSLFKNKYKYNWFAAVMRENDYGTIQIDEALALDNFNKLKMNKTFVCPTLVVWYNYFHPDTLFENNTSINNMPKDLTEFWQMEIDKYRKKDESYKRMALKKYETFKKVTFLLYKAGVSLITGTDAMNPYCYPGYSLHREFELLSECGIPNAAILKMSTFNAAAFLNLKNYGQIKEGFVASMVLLDENPIIDIKNTTKINSVILKGKVLDKSTINEMTN